MMTLALNRIYKSFRQGDGQVNILENLDLELKSSEIVAIIGESGSGKSTLLSLLAGFEFPEKGSIAWNGDPTTEWNERRWSDFRKQSLGFIFQNYHLIPYLNAVENVALPLKLLGLDGREAYSKASDLLSQLGLSARLDHLPNQMSGGECQRVAIARALVHRPNLILADEPTGSLDAKTGQTVLDLLFRLLHEANQTALIVTHSHEVADRCHRVLTLKQGKLWSS